MRFVAIVLVAPAVLCVERVHVAGGGQDIDVVDTGFDFQLDAARAHFAALGHVFRIVIVAGQNVLLLDLIHRRGDQGLLERLVLHADFVLLTFSRFEGLAATLGSGSAQCRQEGFRVADIRRQAEIGDIGQADASGEFVVALGFTGRRQQVLVVDFRPVLTTADGQDPLVEFDLVLQVHTSLAQGVVPLGGQCRHHAAGVVVVLAIQVDRQHVAGVVAVVLAGEMPIVHARQSGVFQGAGVEFVFQVVIDGVGDVVLAPVDLGAVGPGEIGHAGIIGDEAAQVKALVAVTHVGVARSGAVLQVIGDVVAEVVAEDVLVTLVVVEIGIAGKEVAVDSFAVWTTIQRADPWQRLIIRYAVIALDLCQQGQESVLGRRPGQARRQQHAFTAVVLDLFATLVGDANQAIGELLLFVDRAAGVEGAVDPVVTARPQFDLAALFGGRALGDHVDQAARLVLPVEYRRRPLEHFDALQGVRVDLRRATEAARVRNVGAIEIQRRRRETTAGDFIGNRVAVGVAAGVQPRRVTQGLGQVARALGFDLVGGDHVDGLRDFQDRRIGLGAGGAAGRNVTVHRTVGRLHGNPRNAGGAQLNRRARPYDRQQRIAAVIVTHCFEFAPSQ
ncbi:hypothetical protein D3C86_643550 [compost metagenome]